MVTLAKYQERAISKSITKIEELLNAAEEDTPYRPRRFLMQAPTGSGKTVMTSQTVERIAQMEKHDVAFVFLAPNKLEKQAQESFERHIAGGSVSFLDTLPSDKALPKNSILFLNWSSINKKGNNLIKEREDGKNLSTVVARTKDAKRNIILIIDESHHTAGSKASKDIIASIEPTFVFEISATPSSIPMETDGDDKTVGRWIKVPLADVVSEGIICKAAYFNKRINEHQKGLREAFNDDHDDSNSLSIYSALKERDQFERELVSVGSPYIPLMGIQLPSEGSSEKDTKEEISKVDEVISFLMKNGIAREEIAVYLSDRKENLEGLSDLHSPIKVVIFKVAVAVGWDCPRLKTGALLRDTKTKPFAIQTLGRWMRQPLRKTFESNEYLNRAYLYTEAELLPRVAAENDVDIYVPLNTVQRLEFKTVFGESTLLSYERVSANSADMNVGFMQKNFTKTLRKQYNLGVAEQDQKSGIADILETLGFNSTNEAVATGRTVRSYLVDDIDSGEISEETELKRRVSRQEAENSFDDLVSTQMLEFDSMSTKNVSQSILSTIARVTRIDSSSVAKIITDDTALAHKFVIVISAIVEIFKAENPDFFNEDEKFKEVMWKAPDSVEISLLAGEPKESKEGDIYAYTFIPNLSKADGKGKGSGPEEEYLKATNSQSYKDKFSWVLKNGDKGAGNFAIPYDKPVSADSTQTVKRLFYPDWIAYTSEGDIEIHETKSGMHTISPETSAKNKAALAYCEDLNTTLDFKVSFAIINMVDTKSGPVLYRAKSDAANLNPDQPANWEPLI